MPDKLVRTQLRCCHVCGAVRATVADYELCAACKEVCRMGELRIASNSSGTIEVFAVIKS